MKLAQLLAQLAFGTFLQRCVMPGGLTRLWRIDRQSEESDGQEDQNFQAWFRENGGKIICHDQESSNSYRGIVGIRRRRIEREQGAL
jgi:hypothetical protein